MKRTIMAAAAIAAMGCSSAVLASCPPLNAYRVLGVSAPHGTLKSVAPLLFDNVAWKTHITGPAGEVPLHLSAVSGPLDKVLASVVKAANTSTLYATASTIDSATCTVNLAVTALPPPARLVASAIEAGPLPAPAVPAKPKYPAYTLPAGQLVAKALSTYAKKYGWDFKWRVPKTYVLSAPLPIPAGKNVIEGITYVLHSYQYAGAMLDDVPFFSTANHVAAIMPASALNQQQRREGAYQQQGDAQ